MVTTNRPMAFISLAALGVCVAFCVWTLVGDHGEPRFILLIGFAAAGFMCGYMSWHVLLVFVPTGVVSMLAPWRFVRAGEVRDFDVTGGDVCAVLMNGYPLPLARSTSWGLGDGAAYRSRVLMRVKSGTLVWPTADAVER